MSVLVVCVDPTAAAVGQFGEQGNEAGQFAEPHGVAVDQLNGNVYVVDRNNQRIQKFDATGGFLTGWGWGVADGTTKALGSCTTTCFSGIQGSGAGQFDFPEGVAVDNSTNPLDMSTGDVYVVDVRNQRVEKFSSTGTFLLMFGREVNAKGGNVCLAGEECQAGTAGTGNGQFDIGLIKGNYIAIGSSTGTVYVGDENRVQEFSPEGVYQSQITLGGAGSITALGVDSVGNIYVKSQELSGVQKYDSSGVLINTLDSAGDPKALTLASSGDLFIDDAGGAFGHHILRYDSSGNEVSTFDSGAEDGERGIAFGDTAGVLYVLNQSVVRLVALPSPGPMVEPGSESATEVLQSTATVNATVNPEGHDTTYHFEYGPTPSYGTSTPESASIGASFEDQSASNGVTELQPRTLYHFRVVATSSAGTINGPDATFTTLPPVSLDGEFASGVSSSSVTLGAQINPLGADTKYRFEYDTSAYESSAPHGTSVPVPDGDIGSGTSDVEVGEHLQGLTPGIVYHYRVVASNGFGIVESADHAFMTQSVGAQPALPDGRRWELVSPPDKHGALLEGLGFDAALQASVGGEAMSYFAVGATESQPQGQAEGAQVLSTRGPAGWSSQDMATPHEGSVGGVTTGRGAGEYLSFSEDLTRSLVEPHDPFKPFSPPMACTATGCVSVSFPEATEFTTYVRHDSTCASEVSSCYEPLLTGAAGYADVPPGTEFGEPFPSNQHQEFVGAASDLNSVVLASNVGLTPGAPNQKELYEWSAGAPATERLQLISVLPQSEGGGPATGPKVTLGAYSEPAAGGWRPVSVDGSHVFWTLGGGRLYMRDTAKGETTSIGGGTFQAASSDGSKVFFTSGDHLSVCEIVEEAGKDACKLTDLTPAAGGESPGVQLLMPGTSDDGSYGYFVAHGVLSAGENGEKEKAVPGGENLYMVHHVGSEWVTTFIASLSPIDENDWGVAAAETITVGTLTARVSPNGRWLAFMSNRSLTGYDNRDAVTGRPDEEVYLYDALTGRLGCSSCNPTGARPVGVEVGQIANGGAGNGNLVDIQEGNGGAYGLNTGIAANLPGGVQIESYHRGLYQPRFLSDGGRLFFNSSDALVSRDVNRQEDVYEYEPVGVGGCTSSLLTYSEHSGGCVDLISSGTSSGESGFLDASETGGDVFFLTKSKLLGPDFDTTLDVYDAHECSSRVPCFPVSPAVPPSCGNAESCRVAPSSQPSIFGSPSSATFSGAGNIIPSVAKPKSKTAAQVRAEKLRKALKVCRKKVRHVNRKKCEKEARVKYGSRGKKVVRKK